MSSSILFECIRTWDNGRLAIANYMKPQGGNQLHVMKKGSAKCEVRNLRNRCKKLLDVEGRLVSRDNQVTKHLGH